MSYKRDTVEELLADAVTVGEIIDYLSRFPRDHKCLATTDYGDRCHTEQVHLIGPDDIEELENDRELDTTGYSATGIQVRDLDGDCSERTDNVVLIRL